MTSRDLQLIDAIEKNDIPRLHSLIEQGVNVNSSRLPLCRAAHLGRVEIMSVLLDAGAELDTAAPAQLYKSACYTAIASNSFDALKLLVDRGAIIGGSVLKAAAEFARDEKIILFLLDTDAPLDCMTSEDMLNLIAKLSSVAVLKRLLARNVDVSALKGLQNCSLCHRVIIRASADSNVDALIRAMADVGVRIDDVDDDGLTPLHLSARKSCARVLVELGADIDRQDKRGRTALHLACDIHFPPVETPRAPLLLALGANVHLVDKRGRTASHFAVRKRHFPNLLACLAAGGDLNQPDNDGFTVRMLAMYDRMQLPTTDELDEARRRIAKTRFDVVRQRACQICIGLQPLDINSLELCEILMHSFGALGSLIAFHQWWAIATTVRHFHDRKQINHQY